MHREYHIWRSSALDRDMELLVLGHAGAKVLVFPTRGGRFHEYEDLRIPAVLRHKIDDGHLQFFCLDGIDSETFYCFWAQPEGRLRRHFQFEQYVLEEVFPFMQEKNAHPCVIAHGCSLGAFHAASIAFRHPHRFRKLAAFSGRYDLTLKVEHFEDLLSGFYNEDVYYLTPTHFLPNITCPDLLAHLRALDIILAVGRDDPFRENNSQLSAILADKEIPHQLHVWDDRAHSGYYWRRMARCYV